MTIKEFARLCGCNPQTLRYYDHVDLLKPAKVDKWSSYRFYGEEQALAFVKIKNLQRAGFSIEEIKGLLDQDQPAILRAFDRKIAEAEEKLREIKSIRQSYQKEMNRIQEKIDAVKGKMLQSMRAYDPTDEFGITPEEYAKIIEKVNLFFDNVAKASPKDIGYEEFDDDEATGEDKKYLDLLNDSNYTVLYEKHGWLHVRDFFGEIGALEDGTDYALLFRVDQSKGTYDRAFGFTILGMMLAKKPEIKCSVSCSVGDSRDGQNHFWFLKRVSA